MAYITLADLAALDPVRTRRRVGWGLGQAPQADIDAAKAAMMTAWGPVMPAKQAMDANTDPNQTAALKTAFDTAYAAYTDAKNKYVALLTQAPAATTPAATTAPVATTPAVAAPAIVAVPTTPVGSTMVPAPAPAIASIRITPATVTMAPMSAASFQAQALDGSGNPLPTQPAFQWYTTSGTIDANGNYTAPRNVGSDQILAISGGVQGTASVSVQGAPVGGGWGRGFFGGGGGGWGQTQGLDPNTQQIVNQALHGGRGLPISTQINNLQNAINMAQNARNQAAMQNTGVFSGFTGAFGFGATAQIDRLIQHMRNRMSMLQQKQSQGYQYAPPGRGRGWGRRRYGRGW